MKTLLVSNYLTKDLLEYLPNIVCYKWGERHPSLADFACAILDLKLDIGVEAPTESVPSVKYKGYSFYQLSDDIIRLLQAGGVVICLNYHTFINSGSLLYGSKILNAIYEKRQTTYLYEHKFTGQEETSYDWLDLGFLLRTKLDRMNTRPGHNFKVISKLDKVKQYFSYVKEYHKVIQGISRDLGVSHGTINSSFRTDPIYSHTDDTSDRVDVLALTEVTDEPIAVAIKYRRFPGTLVFLPTYNLPAPDSPGYKGFARSIALVLCNVGEYYYETSRRELGAKLELPPWLLEYRAKPAKDADKELKDIEKAKAAAIDKRDRYDRMLTLINGYGVPLEKTIGELFGKEWLGFDVEETEKGHPIDLYIKNPKAGQTLAVQVTGVVSKFIQSDKHFGALMQYLPENEGKNINGRVERVVLIVNTYRDTPLVNRTDESDISVPVQNLVKKNGICLIRSRDLYDLWNLWDDSSEKLSADDIFKQLFECEGIWQRK
ncbi:MAG: hypothetical protein V3T73_04240 [Dehalococcoidales bacterium]